MISCFRTVAKLLRDLKTSCRNEDHERMSPHCTRELRLGSPTIGDVRMIRWLFSDLDDRSTMVWDRTVPRSSAKAKLKTLALRVFES